MPRIDTRINFEDIEFNQREIKELLQYVYDNYHDDYIEVNGLINPITNIGNREVSATVVIPDNLAEVYKLKELLESNGYNKVVSTDCKYFNKD